MVASENAIATDFSNDAKSLQPRMLKLAFDTKQKQFKQVFFSEFNTTERMILKSFDIAEPDLTDSQLQHLLRVFVENNDIFLKFHYDVRKVTQECHVKLNKDAELRKQ